MKRILAFLMVAMLVVTLLAACQKKEAPAENPAAEVGYMEGANANQIELFGDLTGTKLRVADDVVLDEWEEAFYEQLQEQTGMEVEIEPMSSAELTQKIDELEYLVEMPIDDEYKIRIARERLGMCFADEIIFYTDVE